MKVTKLIGSVVAACTAASEEQVMLANGVDAAVAPLNVAIIGAGAGGSSSAYYLSKFAAASGVPINITVFERNNYVGGRSSTVNAYNDTLYPVELGASIFVKLNHILVDAVQTFKLSTGRMVSGTESIPGAALGVWTGTEFALVQDTDSLTWWQQAKYLWRYGLAPIRTMNVMRSTTGK